MKKRLYEKPNIQLVPIVPEQAVADVCWAYAMNKQPFYYNVPGRGYAILKIASSGGCNGGVLFDIDYSATDLTPEEAKKSMVRYVKEFKPNKTSVDKYDVLYKTVYKKLYPKLNKQYSKLKEFSNDEIL